MLQILRDETLKKCKHKVKNKRFQLGEKYELVAELIYSIKEHKISYKFHFIHFVLRFVLGIAESDPDFFLRQGVCCHSRHYAPQPVAIEPPKCCLLPKFLNVPRLWI